MKMVSAAKLRRAQDAITQMRPYAEKLKEILGNLSSTINATEGGEFSVQREAKKILIVAVTSNRGLAGAFNSNILKAARNLVSSQYQAQQEAGNVSYITIGKKATDTLTRAKMNVLSSHNNVFDGLSFDKVSPVAERIMQGFASGEFDRVILIYNRFKNAAVQITTEEQFLPVLPLDIDSSTTSSIDYIFEPNKEEIVQELIPKSLKIQLYKAVLDSHAAEHGARMTAMNKATDNAKEMLKELRLSYNKARQAAITNEILEIVGGAEALKG